jgi:hypothetical protein
LASLKTKTVNDLDIIAAQDHAAALHQIESNPDFTSTIDDPPYYEKGQPVRYLVNPIWKSYRNTLAKHIKESGIKTINATNNGCLHTQARDDKGNFILNLPNFKSQSLDSVLEEYK